MNLQPASIGTSGAGPMRTVRRRPQVIPRPFRGEGTTARGLSTEDSDDLVLPLPSTNAGWLQPTGADEPQSTASAIMELRRLSGLTWEQLADLFGVARRSLHFWASGKPMNSPNEVRLRRLVTAIRRADRGSAETNRAMLLEDHDGVIPLDLLKQDGYDDFIELVATGPGRRSPALPPLSPEEQTARRPLPPDVLVAARQDGVAVPVARVRAGRAVKVKR